MKKTVRFLSTLVVLALVIAGQAHAKGADFLTESERAWLENRKVLKIDNQMNWPPFDFNEDGVPKGYAIDHIKAIANKLGVELEFVFGYDWHNQVEAFKRGEFDVMPVFFSNDERKKFTLFTQSYYKGKLGVFTRDDNIGIDLENKRVGMEKAHGSIPLVKRLLPDSELIEVDTKKELIQKLATKQLDAIVANPFVIHHVAKKNEVTNLVVSSFLNLSKEEENASAFHIGVHKDLPVLHGIMEKAIANMSEAERAEIENRWANISIVKGVDWMLVGQISGGVLLVFLFLVWNNRLHKKMVLAKTRELNELNEQLEQKVIERTKTLEERNEQLEVAQRKAEIANQAKSQFLANMSHELRTPLNAVTGFSELLSSIVTDEKQKSYLEAIKTAGASLLTLINDILDLSKIEAGKFELQKTAVDIRGVIRDIEQIFTLKVSEKGLDFVVEIDENIPDALLIDEVRIRQVLLNLLSNAVKFTDEGKIVLSAKVLNRQEANVDLILSVEDTGIGVPEEEQESIFDVFTQQSGQKVEQYGGTGLGLSITKKLVELMDGQVGLESDTDRGSVFSISLKETEIVLDAIEVGPEYGADEIQFEKAVVLVADDIESNRILLTEALGRLNLQCITAENGLEALSMAEEQRPDIIILDIRMPVLNGYETVQKLKDNPATRSIPVIALTASATKEDESHGLDSGFEKFLPKPIKIARLATELTHYLAFSVASSEDAAGLGSDQPEGEIDHPEELLLKLKNEILPAFEVQQKAMVMEELGELAKMMYVAGEKHNVHALVEYGKALENDIALFDVAAIDEKFQSFEEMVNALTSRLGE